MIGTLVLALAPSLALVLVGWRRASLRRRGVDIAWSPSRVIETRDVPLTAAQRARKRMAAEPAVSKVTAIETRRRLG